MVYLFYLIYHPYFHLVLLNGTTNDFYGIGFLCMEKI